MAKSSKVSVSTENLIILDHVCANNGLKTASQALNLLLGHYPLDVRKGQHKATQKRSERVFKV